MNKTEILKSVGFIFLISIVVLFALSVESKWIAIAFALITVPCGWWFLMRKTNPPGSQEIKNSSISCCHYLYNDLEYRQGQQESGEEQK